MYTSFDNQYEAGKQKVGYVGGKTIVMVAGEITIHSEAIKRVLADFKDNVNARPEDITAAYGRAIQDIKARQAEGLFLSPLGMNSDTFLAQQHDFQESFIHKITDQLQGYVGDDVDAIVVGSDGSSVRLFTIDKHGLSYRQDDIGFAAIGIGGWHARSRLMQGGFHPNVYFADAIAAVYAAKKSAEAAPGVGLYTDMHIVLRDQMFPVWPEMQTRLAELYDVYEDRRKKIAAECIEELRRFKLKAQHETKQKQESDGENPPSHGGTSSNAAQTAQSTQEGKTGGL
jgi:hypothetical protein